MKKFLSILLSASMLLTMLAGLNITVFAAEPTDIAFEGANGALVLYEGWCAHTENDGNGDYFVYDVPLNLLNEEGNALTVTYDDTTSETYISSKVPRGENEEEYDLEFMCGDKALDLGDARVEVHTNQNTDNRWLVGNTYQATLCINEMEAPIDIRIEPNPVRNVEVHWERDIVLAEESLGDWSVDEGVNEPWFTYFSDFCYLNYAGVSIDIEYENGDTASYSYRDDNWLPVDEHGNEIDTKFLDFSFDQFGIGNHFYAGAEGKTASVTFYGKGVHNIPVHIIAGDFDEGELVEGDHRKIFFIGEEKHNVTFTPEEDGVYLFEESLADNIIWDREHFTGSVLDENGDALQSLSNEWCAFVLEGGKTYTLSAQKLKEGPSFEFLSVRNVNTSVSINFTPAWGEYYSFYNGARATDDGVYRPFGELEVEFSNGTSQTFYCNWNRRFVYYYQNEDDREEEINLEEYARRNNIDTNLEFRCEIGTDYWTRGADNNYYDIYVGTAHQRVYVDDYIVDSPYTAVQYVGTPIEVYYGTANTDHALGSNNEWVDYQRYDIDFELFEKEGNYFTVTYPDDTIENICYQRNEEYDYFSFVDEHGEEYYAEDFTIIDNQSPDNQWELGQSYEIEVYFKGQPCTVNVAVVDSPIDSVEVTVDGDAIEVFENIGGRWEHDNQKDEDYFRYDDKMEYLRNANPVITVHFKDGLPDKVFTFKENGWLPETENGEELEERYLEFRFDQDDNHILPGAENKAYVSVIGVRAYLDVNVTQAHDFDAVELGDGLTPVLFYSNENHTFTYTPDESAVYELSGSLGDQLRYSGDFSFSITDGENNELERTEGGDDSIYYNLTAGETYTISVSRLRDEVCLEFIGFLERLSIADIEYTYGGETLSVSEGDYGNGDELYEDGSIIKLTLSNGASETFTCNNREFRADDGRNIWNFANDFGIYCNCDININPSSSQWNQEEDAYYTLTIGNASVRIDLIMNESAVESIRYISSQDNVTLIKGLDFEYNEFEQRTNMRKGPFFRDDAIEVIYSDGRESETFYYEYNNEFAYYDEDSKYSITVSYSYDENRDYNAGDNIQFEVAYQTGRVTINAAVAENNVESIEFTPVREYSVYKEYNGRWESHNYWDYERQQNVYEDFFYYDVPNIYERGNCLTVNYTDGSKAEFEYNGRFWIDEDGNRINDRYFYTVDEQWSHHWYEGSENYFYVEYMDKRVAVPVSVVDPGEWSAYVKVRDSRGNTYESGDTIYIEKGQRIFVYFETDFRNREHGVSDFAGFSDGYDEGTLSAKGFDIHTGRDYEFGYSFGDQYGFQISSNNLRVGTKASLGYWLYSINDEDEGYFDYVNTPHYEGSEGTINVEIVEHSFVKTDEIPATCCAKGYSEYTCELCGIIYRSDFTDYADHDYDETVFEATPNARGYTQFTCRNCGYEYCGSFTDYASDAGALSAAIAQAKFYTNAKLSNESIQLILDEAESHVQLSLINAPQAEYDYAVGEILTVIYENDPLSTYEAVAISDDTVSLENDNGDETTVSFTDNTNEYCAPLDINGDGVVNAKDFALLVQYNK